MQTKDLQIGDWVVVDNNPLQIAALGTTKAGFADSKNEMFYHYYDVLQPVRLTTKILKKNGAYNTEKKSEFWRLRLGTRMVYGEELFFGNIFGRFVYMKYVHELQHVLRLCGIETDINL